MVQLRFAKYHGLGNDFVLLDHRAAGGLISAELARRLCDRHRGIGADGVLSLLPSRDPRAALRLHIWNADGSQAEMCGNGLRCVVRHLHGEAESEPVWVDTDAGLRCGQVEADGRVMVTLGRPQSGAHLTFEKDGKRWNGLTVSMGNPHFVLEPVEASDLRAVALDLGPWLQARPEFPESTNVEVLRPTGDGFELWVYERGAGLTQACGTGAAAAAVAMDALGLSVGAPRLTMRLPGGRLEVALERGPSGAIEGVSIIGEAVRVFEGGGVW